MGWEKRGGRQVYYRKRREGRRVVSEYIGAGELAQLLAQCDALEREDRERERETWRAECAARDEVDRALDNALALGRALLAGAMLATGHHTHKGTWRHRRKG